MPTGATTGNVVVTVSGVASNGVSFTVTKSAWSNGYLYRRTITIDHTKVPNTDQTNFPVLISGTYPYLATTANGGNVTNANGYDIIFTSDPSGTNLLAFERESYNASTGAVNFWVRIPTIYHAADTVFYMFYGNSSVTTDQSNKTGVWDSNYIGVWHLPDGTTLSLGDSTTNGNSLSNSNVTATTGQIDGGASFDGTNAVLSNSNGGGQFDLSTYTWEVWARPTWVSGSLSTNPCVMSVRNGTPTRLSMHIRNSLDQGLDLWNGSSVRNFPFTFSQNNWFHLVVTHASGDMRLYINGVFQSSQNYDQSSQTLLPLQIGFSGNDSEWFLGLEDEVRISNIVRSADWVTTEYNNQSSPSTFYSVGAAQ